MVSSSLQNRKDTTDFTYEYSYLSSIFRYFLRQNFNRCLSLVLLEFPTSISLVLVLFIKCELRFLCFIIRIVFTNIPIWSIDKNTKLDAIPFSFLFDLIRHIKS
jgi:hypothetical protein